MIIANVFYIAWSFHFSANVASPFIPDLTPNTMPLLTCSMHVVLVLPFFVLRGLQVKKKTMIGIYATFGLAFVDLGFSLTRFLIIHLGAGSFKPLTLIRKTSSLLLSSAGHHWSNTAENRDVVHPGRKHGAHHRLPPVTPPLPPHGIQELVRRPLLRLRLRRPVEQHGRHAKDKKRRGL